METLTELLAAMGTMTFADYMREALYHPRLGYYEKPNARRVGNSSENDFSTAEAIGPVFADLVVEAARKIVGDETAGRTTFVEIGAEPDGENVFSHACPPFAGACTVKNAGDIPKDRPIMIFSNELFDAQPFHRVIRRGGLWRECGVKIEDGKAVEILLEKLSAPVAACENRLPAEAPDGYRTDLPLEAVELMGKIAANENVVAVVAFDYGLDWDDILRRRPTGTARSYRSQKMCDDILADPGFQDITCHIAWDGLEGVLKNCGFANVKTERQEAFFIRHSMQQVEKILKRGDPVECGKLRELLHPMRMGEIFQVLSCTRD